MLKFVKSRTGGAYCMCKGRVCKQGRVGPILQS